MAYLKKKGHPPDKFGNPKRGGVKNKPRQYLYLTLDQVEKILHEIEKDAENKNIKRDHCAIYLSYFFGLRIGECAILERKHFRFIQDGQVFIPTLKQRDCDEKGQKTIPERSPPYVESFVVNYVTNYLQNSIKPEENWLFTTAPRKHISTMTLFNVFTTYCLRAGLAKYYSWHSLRHGRAVYIYENFTDQVMVKDMLRHSDLDSSKIYINLSPGKIAQMREKLESIHPNIRAPGA